MDFPVKTSFSYRKKGHTWFTIAILCYYNCKMVWGLPAKLVLHPATPGDKVIEISGKDCPFGASFTNSQISNVTFSCACVTGVWAFYEGRCQRPALIAAGANNHCFEMKFKIVKVALLSSPFTPSRDVNTSTVAVFSKDMSMLSGRIILEGNMQTGNIDKSTQLGNNLSFVTTGESSWTVKSPFCLKPEAYGTNNFYCSFGLSNGIAGEMDVSGSCNNSATENNIKPLICSPFLTGSGKCPYSPLVFKNDEETSQSSGRKPQGRTFFTGSQSMKNYSFRENVSDDNPPWPQNSSVEIGNEIWNYMIAKAEKIAGLRPDKPLKQHRILAFRLLEMCKILIQNVCPDHYVKDIYYDIVTAVFINVQKNAFKFEEVLTDFPTEKRIVKALTECSENLTEPYPFFDRRFKLDHSCTIEAGSFDKFGTINELSVGPNISSMSHEPIIDTAWHMFVHAHSACFQYFVHSDHHRFTTIMMPLFTNAINDIWYRGNWSLSNDAYSNALGSSFTATLLGNHCSIYPRLESQYPWDLERPKRSKESRRRKREVNQEYQCMGVKYLNDCA